MPKNEGFRSVLCCVLVSVLAFNLGSFGVSGQMSGDRLLRKKVARSKEWNTLGGSAPLVVARGGLSGLFPDSTNPAYMFALNNSVPNVVLYCDVQLTKDAKGICRTGIRLDNSTNIGDIFKNEQKTYAIGGKNVAGWFSIDYSAEDLLNDVLVMQSALSRTAAFDYLPLLPTEGLETLSPPSIWYNVEYPKFYEDNKLRIARFMQLQAAKKIVGYISSPEVGFLKTLKGTFRKTAPKLVLKFFDKNAIETSTNRTYGDLLQDFTFLKAFAAGILVPKNYIWPVDKNLYLGMPTTLVQDAHKAGLEVHVYGFSNDDYTMSYNYSYDPVREYLQFVNNGAFSVDGFVTDFPVTASTSLACYVPVKTKYEKTPGNPLIISNNGASGNYPGCTDVAYKNAVDTGVDYIDCSVQMTKDGIPICRESPDLLDNTDAVQIPSLVATSKTIPEIQPTGGIFTFFLKWKEIQELKPQISSPFQQAHVYRNDGNDDGAKFMTLIDFLEFGKTLNDTGVLINIQNARYLAAEQGLDITEAVLSSLKQVGYDNMTDRVLVQSDDSAVLSKIKESSSYKLIYRIVTTFSMPDSTIKEIKSFADGVTLSRNQVIKIAENLQFLYDVNDIVKRMQKENLTVFVSRLRNEFMSLAFDYQADPTLEINTLVELVKVDGIFTEFPATATAYLNNACRKPRKVAAYSMFLVEPKGLIMALPEDSDKPALAPAPALSTVVEPPLPPISAHTTAPAPAPSVSNNSKSDAIALKPTILHQWGFCFLLALVNAFIFFILEVSIVQV